MSHRIRPTQVVSALGVMLAILVALALRWQSVPVVQKGWLDTDVYRFVRQAQIISETGGLPERDDMRWLPLGRDLSRQLSFSSYCLAGLYAVMRWIQPIIPLSDAALWYPLLCFALSQVVLYFLVNRLFNRATALLATFLFAIFPTVLFRSTAGYADRDSLCLLLSLTSYLCFVQALTASSNRARHLWAWLSGIAQMLLNATWEGSGLFSAVIAGFFSFKVLWGQLTRAHVSLYLGWALPGLASLLLWTKTYHSFAPYALLAWGMPLLSGLAIGIYLAYQSLQPLFARFIKTQHFVANFANFSVGVIALGSTVLLISIAVGVLRLYTGSTSEVLNALWDNFQSPLGRSRLMRSVSELYNPYTIDWVKWYGVSFLVIIAGALLALGRVTRFLGINLWVALISWQLLIGGIVYSRFSPTTPLRGDDLSQKESLPPKSVIAAWWDYGSQINLIGNQATIIDEDHFIPYWIHLMARQVFCAQKAEEALAFLKAHNVSYLAMSAQDLRILRTISILGSDESLDRLTMEPVYLVTSEKPFPLRRGGHVIRFLAVSPIRGDFVLSIPKQARLPADQWVIQGATLQFDSIDRDERDEGISYIPVAASVMVKAVNGGAETYAAFPRYIRFGNSNQVIEQKDAPLPGILVCFPPSDKPSDKPEDSVWQAFYLSENTAKLLSARLLLLGEEIPSFHRVYPKDTDPNPNMPFPLVGIWKVDYPSTIISKPQYLATEFPSVALRRSWTHGHLRVTNPVKNRSIGESESQ